jgi:hypothetical protein
MAIVKSAAFTVAKNQLEAVNSILKDIITGLADPDPTGRSL